MLNVGANPGRSGHRLAAEAGRIVFDTRQALAELFNVGDPRQVVFEHNASGAINLALHGMLRRGDHVVTTSMEHNSVMRPLNYLREHRGINVDVVATDEQGQVYPEKIGKAVTAKTRLVVVNHASNVVGTIAPLAEIREAIGSVPMLVDAAQTAGALPIDMQAMGVDLLAFTGHKSLLGPMGTGGLCIRPGLEDELEPLKQGGTGSRSEHEIQPEMLPDRYESGTANAAGLAGLGAGLAYLAQRGIAAIREHEIMLTAKLLEGLKHAPGVTAYGPEEPQARTATVSINISELTPSEAGFKLDRQYGIMVRVGLHCAPAAHRTLGTLPEGTVRLAAGAMTTLEQIDTTVNAVREIAEEARA